MRKNRLIIISLISTILLSGCKDVQIFRNNEPEPALKPVDAAELETDTFYIKNGAKFFKPVEPNGSAKSSPDGLNRGRVMGITPDLEGSCPIHYKDEVIAYTTADVNGLEKITLERMKDLGYSIGLYNGAWNPAENSITFNTSEKMFENTSFAKIAESLESKDIKVTGINGTMLSNANVDATAGVIVGLEANKTYTITFYAGTYFHEMDIVADCHMFSTYELFNYGKEYTSFTQNGYMEFDTPEDLKSGYYIVNGQGFFEYLNVKKGEPEPVNMNEPYYDSEKDMLAAYSRQYSINVPNPTTNMAVAVEYENAEEIIPQGIVFSPDGTRYDMVLDQENARLSLTLAEAKAGEWTINILPSSTNIVKVDVTDSSLSQELTRETYNITLAGEMQNALIKCYYKLLNGEEEDPNINGNILTPDGNTIIMENETEKTENDGEREELHCLIGRLPYAAEGEYEITVNHFPNFSEISEPVITKNGKTETDTITVEE